jgi:hypothetical protein
MVLACAKQPAPVVEASGGCADANSAKVCTWSKSQGDSLIEVGATVPLASIENAPASTPMVWPPAAIATLDVPAAAQKSSGFSHFTMYWESTGHPPGPYLTPHFDFHFYTVANADRLAIDCKDEARPAAIPDAYALPDIPLPPMMSKMTGVPTLVGVCVPQMGMHSLLRAEMESKDLFRGTMVIGYYHAKPIFIEPMITKAMLMERKSFDLPIPSIPGIGTHPSKFHAAFDNAKQEYRFTFSGFVTAG